MLLLAIAAAAAACLVSLGLRTGAAGEGDSEATAREADEVGALIDSALYTRAEFFGAQARVPFPFAEARNRLAALRERRPGEPRLALALARLDEKLGRYESAREGQAEYLSGSGESFGALEEMAAFQHRRALFAGEAATLEKMLSAAPAGRRREVLDRLVRLAESQRLEAYLSPEFFERVIAEHPTDFDVVAGYVDRLAGKREAAAALDAVRRHGARFPSRRRYFMEKEISVLSAAGRAGEAEAVYLDAFDPFWPDDLSARFYDFLREQNRYRAYGRELREAARRDPTDFRTAVRLFHYRRNSYGATGEVFPRLEAARAARGIAWEPGELATAARLLIGEGDGDAAARFLYTLVARGQMEKGSEARARVLYQLFELLSDAGDERLALTRGDLNFYREVAGSDPHPGMLGGLLSLVLSGESPASEMAEADQAAVKLFNRAAAYRVFNAYREEFPTSPELAQMYLDVVRLYTAAKEPQVAAAALAEFERRYGDAPQYAEVALRLADCYVLLGRHEEERDIYRRVLDYLGRSRADGKPLLPSAGRAAEAGSTEPFNAPQSEPTEIRPSFVNYPPPPSPGIRVREEGGTEPGYYYEGTAYTDHLVTPAEREFAAQGGAPEAVGSGPGGGPLPAPAATYADVLARHVASLSNKNRTEEILAFYAAEIKKYPGEQGLYEQMLQWLGQTNLFDEQLRVYKEALGRFPGETWRDRLARWLLRRERKREFEEFSRELVAKLDDVEAERYLSKFLGGHYGAKADSFEAGLYLGLYRLAHARFPDNLSLVRGLLKFYAAHGRWDEYRQLLAEYYFVSPEIREQFLSHLAERGELRARLDSARERLRRGDEAQPTVATLPYRLFRADAAARLSNYEEAVDAYRELNRLYPATPEFAERLIAFTRSLGGHNRRFLEEAAAAARELAEANPAEAAHRTRAGEIFAELGDYERARAEWARLVQLAPGDGEAYLEAATVYWDYFQYGDALETINLLRRETGDGAARAFEAGAILEAMHRLPEAVAEYVRALDENSPGRAQSSRRLLKLFARPGVQGLVAAAYSRERAANRHGVTLGYAALLKEAGLRAEASRLLAGEVARSVDAEFVGRVREEFAAADDDAGERACLRRLIRLSGGARQLIASSLQLAASHAGEGEREAAASVLRGLVGRYPSNYGVLQEAAAFYRRLGLEEESLSVLRAGAARGKGRYRRHFARSLAARLLELNRLAEARRVLEGLHAEDPLDLGLFRELARVHVRAADREALGAAFARTLEAVRATDAGSREVREQVAELRLAMAGAFTRLRDYRAAMEQHIEIVNRDPEDEEAVEAAIAYAERHGGAEELLSYYQKTAAQAYKNYRWEVILARIHEAKGDLAAAARSYEGAVANRPEMVELHAALAGVLEKAGRYDDAAASFGRAAELSNDDPQYLRRTAGALEKAGRRHEAEAVRQRLPAPAAPKRVRARELFADAERALAADRAGAVEQYRRAFEALSADPYRHDLQASEITGYVQALRDAEGLDLIFERLWLFREKLLNEAALAGSTNAGRARATLGVLDGAIHDAVGSAAAGQATGGELARLFQGLREKIEASMRRPEAGAGGTLALLQNLGHRAGFVALEELILVGRLEAARGAADAEQLQERLAALASFYASGGEYERAAELFESEPPPDAARLKLARASLLAEYWRLAGDTPRELAALAGYYEASGSEPTPQPDPMVGRYFGLLHASGPQGRETLGRLARESSRHCLQLANFAIAKGERGLAHEAITCADLPAGWKLAQDARVSLALREFDGRGEASFRAALRPASIGALVEAARAGAAAPVGDEWSRLETDFGRWLYLSGTDENRARAGAALPAIVEARPRDAGAHAELARWLLSQGDGSSALEHLSIAHELSPDEPGTIADLGSAFFLVGERERAAALWARLIEGDAPDPGSCLLYLETLARHGLAREVRERLFPAVAGLLKGADSTYYGREEKLEKLKPLLAALSSSFAGTTPEGRGRQPSSVTAEDERAAYFGRLCEVAPDDTSLPRLIVEEGLVGRARLGDFYALLVGRSEGLSSYDYDYEFRRFTRGSFVVADPSEAYDHAASFETSEPEGDRIGWQKLYLEYLLEEGREAEAGRLLVTLGRELERRYAPPEWFRLAEVRLKLRAGRVAEAVVDLKSYAGAEVSAELPSVAAPSVERLSKAVVLLREEKHDAGVAQLLDAAYSQLLALGQYQTPYFVGLARVAFEAGDAERGRRLLELLVGLSDEETKDEAAAGVSALAGVKERFAALGRSELPEQVDGVERAEALRLAAETAGSFGLYEDAALFRQSLSAVRPGDYTNRIELARLLAAAGRSEEAAAQLSSVVADRLAPRAARWQAVWVAPEVTGGKRELWDLLLKGLGEEGAADGEMSAALKARELWAAGRTGEAADLAERAAAGGSNPLLDFFRGLLEAERGNSRAARRSFAAAFRTRAAGDISAAFGAGEESASWKLIRLHMAEGRPHAALKLASLDPSLGESRGQAEEEGKGFDSAGAAAGAPAGTRHRTLKEMADQRREGALTELLGLLSAAAEGASDFDRAIEFENARGGRLTDAGERAASIERVALLERMRGEAERARRSPLVIDRAPPAGT